MTRILLILLIVFSCSFMANAQFSKGKILLGGSLSFTNNKTSSPNYNNNQKSSNGVFNISLGKAARENAVFGINLNYQHNSFDYLIYPGFITVASDIYGVGIFYRQYKNLGKEFYFFGEAGGGYYGSTSTGKDSIGNKLSTGTINGGQIYLTPGIAYKISKKFFLELSIPQLFYASYSGTKSKTGSTTTSTSDAFVVGLNLNANPLTSLGIGFRFVL
jgi:hypothetical protein